MLFTAPMTLFPSLFLVESSKNVNAHHPLMTGLGKKFDIVIDCTQEVPKKQFGVHSRRVSPLQATTSDAYYSCTIYILFSNNTN